MRFSLERIFRGVAQRDPFERAPRHRSALLRLDVLLRHVPQELGLVLSVGDRVGYEWLDEIVTQLDASDVSRAVVGTTEAGELRSLRSRLPDWVDVGYVLASPRKLSEAQQDDGFDSARCVFLESGRM